MRRWPWILVGALLVPFVIHGGFHLADWAVWGLGQEPSPLRALLLPFFDDSPLGLTVHAGEFLAVMAAIGVLAAMAATRRQVPVWYELRSKDGTSTYVMSPEEMAEIRAIIAGEDDDD